jgi:histidine ammonia-lyase
LHQELRKTVSVVEDDEYLHPLLKVCEDFIQERDALEFTA